MFHIIPTINGNYFPNNINWFGFVMETACLGCSNNVDKLFPVLNYAPYSEEILEVWLHAFSTSVLDGGKWSVPHPSHVNARERALGTHWV